MKKKLLLKEEYGSTRGYHAPGDRDLGLEKTCYEIRDELSDFSGVSLYVDTTDAKSINKSIVVDLTDYEVNDKTIYVFIDCEGIDPKEDTYSYKILSVTNKNEKNEIGSEQNVSFEELVNDLKLIISSLQELKAEMNKQQPVELNESHELKIKLDKMNKILRD